jgi:hypothetical protein
MRRTEQRGISFNTLITIHKTKSFNSIPQANWSEKPILPHTSGAKPDLACRMFRRRAAMQIGATDV